MNFKKSLSLFLFLAFLQLNAQSDIQRIEKGVEKLYEAMVNKDEKNLMHLTSKQLTYGHSSGTIENKEQYIEAVMTGSFDFFSIIPENQTIYISKDIGIARHIFVATGTNNGEKADVRIGVLMTWQKQGDNWQLLARQAYKL